MSEQDSLRAIDIGPRLRAARERMGLSTLQAAQKLHCDAAVIDALESGRFSELGATVFVRGHLRRYADFLHLPGAELLELLTAQRSGTQGAPDLTRVPKPAPAVDTRKLLMPLLFSTAALAFVLIVWWVLQGAKLSETLLPTRPAPAARVTASAPPATATPVATRTAPAQPAAAGPRPVTPQNVAAAAPASRGLRIRARSDCWLEVYAADGRRLYFDLLRAGASYSATAPGPLRVIVGNVPGAELEFDGVPLRVPAGALRNNAALLQISAQGVVAPAAPQ